MSTATQTTPAPFRFDGHGINDAEGQRICKVTSCDPYIYPDGGPKRNEEFDRLSNLFAGAPELLRVLEAIDRFWGDGICSAPVYPGAYLAEEDIAISDLVHLAVNRAKGIVRP